jgi:polyisoprenoid-binding protein YceI
MKKFFIFALAITVFAACNNNSTDAEAAQVGEAQDAAELVGGAYTADVAASSITWTGKKFNGDAHNGTLGLSEGNLAVDNGNITGGSFTIDFSTMAVTDEMGEKGKQKLIGHLSSGDFFETEKYPTATFTITSVEPLDDDTYTHKISGNLEMKGITNNVAFNATVANDEGKVVAESQKFMINRMTWKVEYNNSLIAKVKDEAIKDDLELKITLVANAAAEGDADNVDEGEDTPTDE